MLVSTVQQSDSAVHIYIIFKNISLAALILVATPGIFVASCGIFCCSAWTLVGVHRLSGCLLGLLGLVGPQHVES